MKNKTARICKNGVHQANSSGVNVPRVSGLGLLPFHPRRVGLRVKAANDRRIGEHDVLPFTFCPYSLAAPVLFEMSNGLNSKPLDISFLNCR